MSATIIQLDLSLPFAAKLNPGLRQAAFETKASILRGQIEAYGGNSLYGQLIPGTKIPYNESTELQSLIWEYYSESGMGTPENFESILIANAGPLGPDDWWNYPPGKGGFGLDGTQPNPTLKLVQITEKNSATVYLGYEI